MHSVRADQDIGLYLTSIREARGHGVAVVLEAGAAGPQVDDRRVEFGRQQLLQFGAVDGHEPGAPALGHQLGREAQQPAAVGPHQTLPVYLRGQLRHPVGQSDLLEGGHGIRPQAHPGTDFFQLRRLLVDFDGHALAGQGDGGRQPPDPAADNGNLHSHGQEPKDAPIRNRYGQHRGWQGLEIGQ